MIWTARTGLYPNASYPLYLAMTLFILNGSVVVFLFVVEYTMLFDINPKLSEYIFKLLMNSGLQTTTTINSMAICPTRNKRHISIKNNVRQRKYIRTNSFPEIMYWYISTEKNTKEYLLI